MRATMDVFQSTDTTTSAGSLKGHGAFNRTWTEGMGISDDEVILGVFQCTKSGFYEVQIIRGEYFCTKSGSCDVQIKGGSVGRAVFTNLYQSC